MSNPAHWLDVAIESVMDEVDALQPFATIKRGALGTGNSLCCEVAPSSANAVFLDKNAYFPVTLTFNGKHSNQQVLMNTLNGIFDNLTRRHGYPSGDGWEIVDISNGTLPRIIGREENNDFIAAGDLIVKIYRKDDPTV